MSQPCLRKVSFIGLQLFVFIVKTHLYCFHPSFSTVFFCTTVFGFAAITVTGTALPSLSNIWASTFRPSILFHYYTSKFTVIVMIILNLICREFYNFISIRRRLQSSLISESTVLVLGSVCQSIAYEFSFQTALASLYLCCTKYRNYFQSEAVQDLILCASLLLFQLFFRRLISI